MLVNFRPPCRHPGPRGKNAVFKCGDISRNVLARAKRNVFFKNIDRKEQDKRLTFLMHVGYPKRFRIAGGEEQRKRKRRRFAVDYFLWSADKKKLPICSKFFCKLFQVGQRRINTIAEGVLSGKGVQDKRGGDHKANKYSEKRLKVYEFLSKLKACESHYARNKSKRLYLPSSLNINRLFKLFNSTVDNDYKVKKTFFTKIFETKFNLGFGTPACDSCSYCYRTKTEIQNCLDMAEKQTLITNRIIHKRRAKAFHSLMKAKPEGSMTYIFDLQQVQPIPKQSIGQNILCSSTIAILFLYHRRCYKEPELLYLE